MSEITNADIYGALLDLKGDLGEVKGSLKGHAQTLAEHVEAIGKLQIGAARQRGVLAALATVGTGLGAAAGYAIDLLTMRGHH